MLLIFTEDFRAVAPPSGNHKRVKTFFLTFGSLDVSLYTQNPPCIVKIMSLLSASYPFKVFPRVSGYGGGYTSLRWPKGTIKHHLTTTSR